MPIEINIPSQQETPEDEATILATAVTKNQESEKSVTIQLMFQGIAVGSDATDVLAKIEKPVFTLVKDLRKEIAAWCGKQQQQASSSSSSLSPAVIKLNFVGVTLTDEKERISHTLKRILKNRHLQNPKLLKMFVSMDQNSKLALEANNPGFVRSINGETNSGIRRERQQAGGSGGAEMNMSTEQADAMANMMASNPQMIEMILNSDPTMREMMRTNPEFARQMRDPDTLRSIMRGQASREGRAMQDNEQRAALALIQNHPEGNAAIERALGREGILTENGENSMFSVTNRGQNSLADDEMNGGASGQGRGGLLPGGNYNNNNNQGPLLPSTNNGTNPFADPMNQQLSAMMGGGQQPPANHQPAQFNNNSNNNESKTQKVNDLIKVLTDDMGFEKEIAELAANEAEGDLEKALGLLEEWQT